MAITEAQRELLVAIYASRDHTGESIVEVGLELEPMLERLNELEEALAKKVPVCPHCLVEMKETRFTSYYETVDMWSCDCESFKDEQIKAKFRGCYA